MIRILSAFVILASMALTGCISPPTPYDYSAFKESKPKSILVLPATNKSTDVQASHGLLAQVAYPLAESGYYVFPVAVVEEMFMQNGLTTADDIQAVSASKLHEIFGADAALYIEITDYGSSYMVVTSETLVTANAKLVDLRSGQLLWNGAARASSKEGNSVGGGGVIGILASAAINQIADTVLDKSYDMAGIASRRLLLSGRNNGMLYGPRSVNFETEML